MNEQPELVTVFRSLDVSAHDQADQVSALLTEAGLSPVVLDDSAPGVVEGTYEVRVPAGEAEQAERIIREDTASAATPEAVDDSTGMDLETIFHAEGGSVTAEMESTEILSLLKANDIEAVLIGTQTLPNFPFEVRVPKTQVDRAREVIAEAQAAGPQAAEEGAAESSEAAPEQS
jgi:hypothetical protein